MSGETINGIPRVDPRARRAVWKRAMQRLVATRPGAAVHRMIAAPIDAPIMRASGGRVNLAVGVVPVIVLTSIGACSGQRHETPLVYFTDGDDVILTASNYGAAPRLVPQPDRPSGMRVAHRAARRAVRGA